jgi:transposase
MEWSQHGLLKKVLRVLRELGELGLLRGHAASSHAQALTEYYGVNMVAA